MPLSRGHAVLLDTAEPGTHAGAFCDARAAWLDRRLAALPGPVWLFAHHNPVPIGRGAYGRHHAARRPSARRSAGPPSGRVAHLFHGHCHLALSGSFRGVPTCAPRGTNHAGWPDFASPRFLAASDLAEAYGVILATDAGTTVHMIEHGYEGPIRREGSPDRAEWDRLTMVR